MGSSFWLRIGGYPATEIAPHSAPTWETLADGGTGEITWEFSLTPRSQHQALRADALVQVMCGPMPVATGLLNEPDRTTWQCHAFGLSASLRRFLALDSVGATTRDINVAITQAIARGFRGSNPAAVSGLAAGDPDANPITVGALLDDYASQTGQRWGVNGTGSLYLRADPTGATWLASPDTAAFGVTNEDVATMLAGRYDAGGGLYASTTAGTPGVEEAVDLTDRGPLTMIAAQAILAGMLVRRGETQWTNGVTLNREQITTRGGTPAALAAVKGGQMMRAHGLGYGIVSSAPWLDVVIGKTRYTAGDDVIYVEPTNTAPRTLRDVTAAA